MYRLQYLILRFVRHTWCIWQHLLSCYGREIFFKTFMIIKFLRSSISQDRLNGLSLLRVENERAKNWDFRKVIQQCSAKVIQQCKSRTEKFRVPNHPRVNCLICIGVLYFISLCLSGWLSGHFNSYWAEQLSAFCWNIVNNAHKVPCAIGCT